MWRLRRLENVGTCSGEGRVCQRFLCVRVEWDLRQTAAVWLTNAVAGGGANEEGSGSDFVLGMVLDIS